MKPFHHQTFPVSREVHQGGYPDSLFVIYKQGYMGPDESEKIEKEHLLEAIQHKRFVKAGGIVIRR